MALIAKWVSRITHVLRLRGLGSTVFVVVHFESESLIFALNLDSGS
jgi:hypothetical protein